jgi:hypothetical protein
MKTPDEEVDRLISLWCRRRLKNVGTGSLQAKLEKNFGRPLSQYYQGYLAGFVAAAFMHEHGWPKGRGKSEHPIWSTIRKKFAADPQARVKAICSAALAEYPSCELGLGYLTRHFSEMVRKKRSSPPFKR